MTASSEIQNSDVNSDFSNNLSEENSTITEVVTEKETVVETVTVKPDDIYKKTTDTVTYNKLPWGLIISVGVGMLVLFAAGFVTFLTISKKKGLFK